MKSSLFGLAVLLLAPIGDVHAVVREFNVRNRVPVIDESHSYYQVMRQNYPFRVEIISDAEGIKSEDQKNGRPVVYVHKGERYAVRLYNPLPIQVAINLTVDGLNSITGKPSGISDGDKWIIPANGFITIRGWQVNGAEARRFFFTDKPKSYAQWRGDQLGKNLSANCGVIGAAYFWSQRDLDRYHEMHPIYRSHAWLRNSPPCPSVYDGRGGVSRMQAKAAEMPTDELSARSEVKMKAGTGMGEREPNPTTRVAFDYDTGMYRLAQAVVIYYDFASEAEPNPFPAISYAPEAPESL